MMLATRSAAKAGSVQERDVLNGTVDDSDKDAGMLHSRLLAAAQLSSHTRETPWSSVQVDRIKLKTSL